MQPPTLGRRVNSCRDVTNEQDRGKVSFWLTSVSERRRTTPPVEYVPLVESDERNASIAF
jgi:hypothetical protein